MIEVSSFSNFTFWKKKSTVNDNNPTESFSALNSKINLTLLSATKNGWMKETKDKISSRMISPKLHKKENDGMYNSFNVNPNIRKLNSPDQRHDQLAKIKKKKYFKLIAKMKSQSKRNRYIRVNSPL